MKSITESFLNQHLKRATEGLSPHKAEELWEQPVEKAVGDEWYLDGAMPKKRRKGRTIGVLSSLAACLAVCFLSLYMVSFRVDATVYLDVNPSVTLRLNCNEKVIRAEANNHDGEIVLEDMDLKHTDLDVAVNAILGSMVRHGYLSEAKDSILLSVDSRSAGKTESLRSRLSDEIDACLLSLVGSSAVFDLEVKSDDALETLAEKYGITPGKAALIQRIVDVNPSLDYAELAGLSMNDLIRHLEQSDMDLKDFANYTGTASPGADPADRADFPRSEDGSKAEDEREDAEDDREDAEDNREDAEDDREDAEDSTSADAGDDAEAENSALDEADDNGDAESSASKKADDNAGAENSASGEKGSSAIHPAASGGEADEEEVDEEADENEAGDKAGDEADAEED